VSSESDRCPSCGLAYADDNDTTHECPPGFVRMRNALEILALAGTDDLYTPRAFAQFVRATAREGLGRETE
jgi:hypothetical protein